MSQEIKCKFIRREYIIRHLNIVCIKWFATSNTLREKTENLAYCVQNVYGFVLQIIFTQTALLKYVFLILCVVWSLTYVDYAPSDWNIFIDSLANSHYSFQLMVDVIETTGRCNQIECHFHWERKWTKQWTERCVGNGSPSTNGANGNFCNYF